MRFQTRYLLAITLGVSVLGALVAMSSMAKTPDGVSYASWTLGRTLREEVPLSVLEVETACWSPTEAAH